MKIAIICSSTSSNSLGRALSMAITASCISEPTVYAFDDGPLWVGVSQFDHDVRAIELSQWSKLADDIARDPDTVVWASKSVRPVAEVLARIRSQSPDHRIITDFDDDDVSLMVEYRKQRIRNSISIHSRHRLHPARILDAQRVAVAHANAATFSSNYLQQTISSRDPRISRLKTARIPHTRRSNQPHGAIFNRNLGDIIKVGFFGTVRPHKGLETLVRIASHPGFQVQVFEGQVPNVHDNPSIKEISANSPLSGLYLDVDILVIPSDADSQATLNQLPAKMVDAIAVGCPIAATRTPPITEYLQDDYIQVQDWSNVDSLRRSMSPESLASLSSRSRGIYETDFSPQSTGNALSELICSLTMSKVERGGNI